MKDESHLPVSEQSLVFRLRKRAEIRRQIKDRKSVQEGAPDRIADLLEEAHAYIEELETKLSKSEALLKKAVKMAYEPCPFGYGTEGYYDWWYNRHKLLAGLKS
jgi:AraC-like DNA-binding protein